MSFRRFLRYPIAVLAVALFTTAVIVGCGGAAEETAAPAAPAPAQPQQAQQQEQPAAPTQAPAEVRATNTPVPQGATPGPDAHAARFRVAGYSEANPGPSD